MNAQSKVEKGKKPEENTNLRIWNTLAKTDPAQTKQFSRAGGFKGTAVKPMWVIKRLTEQFGPCGEGWGVNEPKFQVETMLGGETLVYCTVSCWHGSPENILYGVGGDKVVSARRDGTPFCDDEAFKKAFTDAVNNAFKFVGVAADIHMGLFDDSKYVAEVNAEFHPPEKPKKLDGPYTSKTALWTAVKQFDRTVRGCGDLDELIAFLETDESKELIAQCKKDAPGLWSDGLPDLPEFVPLEMLIKQRRNDLEQEEFGNTRTVIDAG